MNNFSTSLLDFLHSVIEASAMKKSLRMGKPGLLKIS